MRRTIDSRLFCYVLEQSVAQYAVLSEIHKHDGATSSTTEPLEQAHAAIQWEILNKRQYPIPIMMACCQYRAPPTAKSAERPIPIRTSVFKPMVKRTLWMQY
jgi:hypothetical protein